MSPNQNSEQIARDAIARQLVASGWAVQSKDAVYKHVGLGPIFPKHISYTRAKLLAAQVNSEDSDEYIADKLLSFDLPAPYKSGIYDNARGTEGMLVQPEKTVEFLGGIAMRDNAKPKSKASPREFRGAKHHRGDNWWPITRTCGLEGNSTTRRMAIMNLAIRGIGADIGKKRLDTFRNVQRPDLTACRCLSSNQSGECPALVESPVPKAEPNSILRQGDIRRAHNKANARLNNRLASYREESN